MFCKNCGKEINENAVVCPYCGVATNEKNLKKSNENNIFALIGFILSFLIPLAGLICSIIGYKKVEEYNGDGKSFAMAGIIISVISLAITLILLIVYGATLAALIAGSGTYY